MYRLIPLAALAAILAVAARNAPPNGAAPAAPSLISAERIWDRAPHSAFTDLIRFRERWFLAFREASSHVSPDGSIRILTSVNGDVWTSSSMIFSPQADLRDPKFTATPEGRLAILTAAAYPPGAAQRHRTRLWTTGDGREWSEPASLADPNFWLWRLTWHRGHAYGFAYETTGKQLLRFYAGTSLAALRPHSADISDPAYPNESSLLFLPDESAVCLLRRDAGSKTALLGRSRAPFRAWTWQDLGVRIGGPHILRLPEPDGRIVAAVRLYDGNVRTSLCWLDLNDAKLTEFLALPSGGDTSYAGLWWHDEKLWVSYYSSHEKDKAAIYLARVRIPRPGTVQR